MHVLNNDAILKERWISCGRATGGTGKDFRCEVTHGDLQPLRPGRLLPPGKLLRQSATFSYNPGVCLHRKQLSKQEMCVVFFLTEAGRSHCVFHVATYQRAHFELICTSWI